MKSFRNDETSAGREGDWADESTYDAARKGVHAMYLVCASIPQRDHADKTDRAPIRDALLASGASPEAAEHNSQLFVHAFS